VSALNTFKDNLKSNRYETLTGARRAIGKTKDLTDDERESAKRAADKHFSADPAAPSTPKAPKAAAGKKASKKASKKAADVAPAAATGGKYGPGKGGKPRAEAATPNKRGPKARASAAGGQVSTQSQIGDMTNRADLVTRVLDSAEKSAHTFPTVDFSPLVTMARDNLMVVMREMGVIAGEVGQPPVGPGNGQTTARPAGMPPIAPLPGVPQQQ